MKVIFLGLCLLISNLLFAGEINSDDNLLFIHHSVGYNWLNHSLEAELNGKNYIDEYNNMYYEIDIDPASGRPDSLAPLPGDNTNPMDWLFWFNDYFQNLKDFDCTTGTNRIIMIKSCYSINNITEGSEPGNPFSWASAVNYKAAFRHPQGPGNTYLYNGYAYKPLEDIFAENPDILFIVMPSPPRHHNRTSNEEAQVAKNHKEWIEHDWYSSYQAQNPGLNNVAVFNLYERLAYPSDYADPELANTLRQEYCRDWGGTDSHPNDVANAMLTQDFSPFLDNAVTEFTGGGAAPDDLSVHSFTAVSGKGTHPNTITYADNTLTINLSSIQGSEVYRAILDPNRSGNNGGSSYGMQNMILQDLESTTLELLEPRYLTFDVTSAVQNAIDSGILEITVSNQAGLNPNDVSLEVMCDRSLPGVLENVTNIGVRFENGDTMITFSEVDSPLTNNDVTCDEYNTAVSQMDTAEEIRYRIYRSTFPIESRGNIISATLVDEIKPLSCWNDKFFGFENCTGSDLVPRYPINDQVIATPETGIYVKRYSGVGDENAYYYVSRSVDGAEDFSTLIQGENTSIDPVLESSGRGMVVLRAIETPDLFQYIEGATLNFYVRWECPPTSNLPSAPYNYVVAVPASDHSVDPAPVMLALHSWGGSLLQGYGWWYNEEKGSILVASNQYPYDWWTAYHENRNTLKPFSEGTVQPFNQARLLSFLFDFVASEFSIDENRLLLAGRFCV